MFNDGDDTPAELTQNAREAMATQVYIESDDESDCDGVPMEDTAQTVKVVPPKADIRQDNHPSQAEANCFGATQVFLDDDEDDDASEELEETYWGTAAV